MKKTVKFLLLAIVSAAMLITGLAGCSSGFFGGSEADQQEAINLTVIIGNTQNSPDPELSLLNTYIDRLASKGGHLCVIIDDGDPISNFVEADLKAPTNGKTENYRQKEINANSKKAAELIKLMKPIAEETNTLAALKLAADNTPKAEEGRKNVLIVLDNGIQTRTGNKSAFPMTDMRVLDVKAQDVMDSLEKSKSIPDLSKFSTIEWYGMGQTVSVGEEGQEPLLNCDIEALKAYYTKVLTKAGVTDASGVFKDHTYKPSSSDHSAMPHVSTVKVSKVVPVPVPEPDEEPSENEKIIGDEGVLHIDEAIRFKPDSTELADPAAAKDVLAGVIERMKKLKGNIVIIGTTATFGDAESAKAFSQKRAAAIKELIVSEGIDADRILVFGAGFSDKDLVQDDLDSNGKLDERIAPYNRAVNIVDEESTVGKKYTNNGTTTRKE